MRPIHHTMERTYIPRYPCNNYYKNCVGDGCRSVSYKWMGWIGWYTGGLNYRAAYAANN